MDQKQKFNIHDLEEKVNYNGKYQIRLLLITMLYMVTTSVQFNQITDLFASPQMSCLNSPKLCTESNNGCTSHNIKLTAHNNKNNRSNLTMQYGLYCDKKVFRQIGTLVPYLVFLIFTIFMSYKSYYRRPQTLLILWVSLITSILILVLHNIYLIIGLIIILVAVMNLIIVSSILVSSEQISEKCLVKYGVLMYLGFSLGMTYFSVIKYFFNYDWKIAFIFNSLLLITLCVICTHLYLIESPSYVAQFNQKESIQLLNYIAQVNGSQPLDPDHFIYNLNSNIEFTIKDLFKHKQIYFQLFLQATLVLISQLQYYVLVNSFQIIKVNYFLQRFSYQFIEYTSYVYAHLYINNQNAEKKIKLCLQIILVTSLVFMIANLLQLSPYFLFILTILNRFWGVIFANLGIAIMELIYPIQLKQQAISVSSYFIALSFLSSFLIENIQHEFKVYPKLIYSVVILVGIFVFSYYDLQKFQEIKYQVEEEIENQNQLFMLEKQSYLKFVDDPQIVQSRNPNQSNNRSVSYLNLDHSNQNN